MENILEITGLTKKFRKNVAVKDVNMIVKKGDIYGFIGKNGAGKTTLMKVVAGLLAPTSGKIKLFESEDLILKRSKVGIVIENPVYEPNFTARQNLISQCKLLGVKDISVIDEYLSLVGLKDIEKKKVKSFSLGMKQRLGIAMALVGEPEFLILDEPINGLDPIGIKEIRDILLNLNKEKNITILISSHILGELSKIATRYGIINNGVLVKEFSASELKNKIESYLEIKVDNIEKAVEILKKEIENIKYKTQDDNIIKLFIDDKEESKNINVLLIKNDINVEYITHHEEDLEEYFLKFMGGKEND